MAIARQSLNEEPVRSLARAWRNAACRLFSGAGLACASWAVGADCGGMILHAHRGAPGQPENSLSAVRSALEGNWDGVELDLQYLSDGTPVLHHDPLLGRTTSLQGKSTSGLSDVAWRDVRLKNREGLLTRETAPFLSQILPVMKATPKLLNAEIKQPLRDCTLVERTIRDIHKELPAEQWFLTAVDRGHLKCARQLDPSSYLGLIVLDPQSLAMESKRIGDPRTVPQPKIDERWIESLLREVSAPVGLHLDVHTLESNPRIMALARQKGLPVFTYSLADDKRHIAVLRKVAAQEQLLPSGAIIDNDPDAFCQALQ